jgi:predicted DNA binding protein
VGTPLHSGQVPRTASVENVAAALDCAASTASVEDVAAALDCAASTASNHLRKAQAQLARTIADS